MKRTIFFSLALALLGWVVTVGANVNLSNEPADQEEVDLAVDPTSASHLIAGSNDESTNAPVARAYETTNGGGNWSSSLLALPAGYAYSADPAVGFDRHGNAYFAVITYNNQFQLSLFVSKKAAGAAGWGAPVLVPNVMADKELMAIDANASSPCVDNIYLAWDNNESGGQTLRVSRSTNAGASFSNPPRVNDTGNKAIGACPAVHPDGTVLVAWGDYANQRLLVDRSFDCGVTFGTDIVAHTWTLPTGGSISYKLPAAADRGIGMFPYLAVDHSNGPRRGRVYLVYNDQGSGVDVFMRYSDDKGSTWSAPIRVNDDPAGAINDQFIPRLAVDSEGAVHVTYYDTRDDPNRRKTNLYYAHSLDGQTFMPSVKVSTSQSDHSSSASNMDYGEYAGLAVSPGRTFALWVDNRGGNSEAFGAPLYSSLSLATTSLPGAVVNVSYSATLSAVAGTAPYTWSATGLPAAFSLDPATGVISGTPTVAELGTYTLNVTVKDATGANASRSLSLVVDYMPLTITTASLPTAKVGLAYSAQLAASGGLPPYTFSATGLPSSLSLTGSGGAISGIPTEADSGSRVVVTRVADSRGNTSSKSLQLLISGAPLQITTSTLPPGQQRAPYTAQALSRQGGAAPFTWGWAQGFTPPPGLLLSREGVLSGMPRSGSAGGWTLKLTLRDSDVPTAQMVSASIPLLIFGLPVARAGDDQTVDPGLVALDGSASLDPAGKPLRYEWTAPAGVTLSDPAVAKPQVTLKKAGPYTFTLAVRNSAEVLSEPDSVSYTVNDLPPIPVIEAEREAAVEATVLLDGRRTTDPNEDPIVYGWSITSGRGGQLLDSSLRAATFIPSQPGTYTIQLAATDGRQAASTEVTITVKRPGCGCGGGSGGLGLLVIGVSLAWFGARRRPVARLRRNA